MISCFEYFLINVKLRLQAFFHAQTGAPIDEVRENIACGRVHSIPPYMVITEIFSSNFVEKIHLFTIHNRV